VAVPKRKMSRSNTRSRRAQWKAAAPTLVKCDRCRQLKLPHTACGECGTYNRRQVLDV
jgi:large subunit ribosomal protein L32